MRVLFAVLVLALPPAVRAQGAGTCAPGTATDTLDAGSVRAVLRNTGVLFDPDGGYEVPKGSGRSLVPTASLWAGGMVGGALRFSGTTFGPPAFGPGPLAVGGGPPAAESCREWDRIWSVTLDEVARYNATGVGTDDLLNWPAALGAPVVDGDGDASTYNLAGGDRPAIYGGQTAWYRMNDRGGASGWSGTAPLGLDVRVTASTLSDTMASAYAPAMADALRHTTHYRFALTYRGEAPVDSAYVGLFIDGDLGFAGDDYVGTVPGLRMVYVYNGDDTDEGPGGYGPGPPALGFVAGDAPEGVVTRLTHVVEGGGPETIGVPTDGAEAYNLMRGTSRDGSLRWTIGGLGTRRTFSESPPPDQNPSPEPPPDPPQSPVLTPDTTDATFTGRPTGYWSEFNLDGIGTRREPGARTMMLAQGPYALRPGQTIRLDVSVVWARAATHLASVYKLTDSAGFARLLPAPPVRDLATILPGDPRLTQPTLPAPPGGPFNTRDPSLYAVPVPNPSRAGTGALFVHLYGRGPVRVRVFDALGRTVVERPVEEREPGPWQISIPTLPAGVYAYEVTAAYEGFEPRTTRGRLTVVR